MTSAKPNPPLPAKAKAPVSVAVAPAALIPKPDGSFAVQIGRPVLWLTPAQFAGQVGVTRKTVYHWIAKGVIPRGMVKAAGFARLAISADALPLLQKKFTVGREHLA